MNMLMKSNLNGDDAEIKKFLRLIFKNCPVEGYVALRAFAQEDANKPPVKSEWRKFDASLPIYATEMATIVAHFVQEERAVFCPPVCLFRDSSNAKESNVLYGPVISVELDARPAESRRTLTDLLGEPTCVVASGGTWTDQTTGEVQDKLHIHWRLDKPATGPNLMKLKQVRKYAADIVAADPTCVPVNHPLRWPGSWHTKGEPRLCRVIEENADAQVNLYEAAHILTQAATELGVADFSEEIDTEGFKTKEPWTRDALMAAAERIENPDRPTRGEEWDYLSKIAMAFYDASHASYDGLEALQIVSKKHSRHDPEYTEGKWEHLKRSPPTRTSAGTLVREARVTDPMFHRKLGDPTLYFEGKPPVDVSSNKSAKPDDSIFEILDLEEIDNLPPPQFLIDRHIPEKSVGFIYGDPGTGKSFIALDIALHIAYGKEKWHGDPISEAEAEGSVVYLAGEGASGMRTRSKAWRQQHGYETKSKKFGLLGASVNFMDDDSGKKLIRSVRAYQRRTNGPLRMIVVDTVSRAMPGADENAQKEMTLFVRACDLLRDEFGCAVIGVHHANKSGEMRGSTVLLGAGDFVLKLERKRGHSVGYLHCEKQKDAPDGWKDSYRFDVVTVGEKESSLVPMRLNSVDAETVPQGLEDAILSALQAAWDRGEPWARKHQGRDRWAVKRMVQDFAMDAHDAELKLEEWLSTGVVIEGMRNKKDKKNGLMRADFSEPDVAEGEDEEAQQGAFE
jgi:KaiC/GvpD/RAD55 family RecA-like ATPase